jgi:excisionase family DNA binding protein
MMKKKKEFLNTRDVAWILDCSPDDVIELAKTQKLQGTKMGRFWRFRHEAVKTYQRQLKHRGIP